MLRSVPTDAPDDAPEDLSDDLPKAPSDLKDHGLALWDAVTSTYDLSDTELTLLAEAARTKDRLEALAAILAEDGLMAETAKGEPKIHPALAEVRAQEILLTRLVASLRLPDLGDSRTQRRGGGRGTYAARRLYGRNSLGGL